MITCTLSLEARTPSTYLRSPTSSAPSSFVYSNAYAVVEAHEQLRAVPFLPGETLTVAAASPSFPAVARGRPAAPLLPRFGWFWFPSARTASVAAAGTGQGHARTHSLGSFSPAPLVQATSQPPARCAIRGTQARAQVPAWRGAWCWLAAGRARTLAAGCSAAMAHAVLAPSIPTPDAVVRAAAPAAAAPSGWCLPT